MKEKFRRLIEQKISEWQEDDVYAVSLYVFEEEDDHCRPVAVLGYNTERQVQKSLPEASDEQEARWNYAFWIQNAEMCLGQGDTAEDIKEWITEQGLWDSEDEITSKFVEFLVAIVQDIHASGLLKDKFGGEIPILIHGLEYYEKTAQQNIAANGEALDRDFVSFCMPCIPEVHDEVRPSQNEMSRAEKSTAAPWPQGFRNGSGMGKQSADKRKAAVSMIAMILIMSLFWVLGLIISDHNKAASNGMRQTERLAEKSGELPTAAASTVEVETEHDSQTVTESASETEKDSYILRYEGFDTRIEIFFKDSVREYDKDGSEWEIDTETAHESAKAYLSDFDIHPLYRAFLLNQISVENPFVPESYDYNIKLTYFDDRIDYDDCFRKSFSLVDVNNDGHQELVFRMYNSPSEVVYILGVQDEKLTCYDILVTHTTHMAFWVYDNGIVEWGQNYDGDEERYYTFTEDGKERELIHFIRESDSDSDLYYNYYYLEGNEESRFSLQSNEEYESLVSSYKGEEPEWFDCESFADIPQNQEITETEIVEKNAKNTGEIRISTSITKLWLDEDEEGAAEINAALREIYEAAETEMEAYNQEILDEYLFEDGVLQEDLEEWLAISMVNYVASIEYADENYLCLSMNGYNYVAGGAHGYYWSDYYVFNRHTGQRLSLEDFVDNSPEDIKNIVKNHIVAAMPYSKGEQSKNALEQNRFFLTVEGLGIHYDVYEIGDYASGSVDLVIPFELFDMKENMWP